MTHEVPESTLPPPETHSFANAVAMAIAVPGTHIHRVNDTAGYYLVQSDNMFRHNHGLNHHHDFVFTREDVMANDWITE